jgi:hypothetical protein
MDGIKELRVRGKDGEEVEEVDDEVDKEVDEDEDEDVDDEVAEEVEVGRVGSDISLQSACVASPCISSSVVNACVSST